MNELSLVPASAVFLAVIFLTVVVSQMKRFIAEWRFRQDWQRSTGHRWPWD